jgi:hypothetical protein
MHTIGLTAKRRAITARLLAFLLPVLVFGVPVASASAAPATPKLVVTDPVSSQEAPANVILPSVIGEAEPEDGVILEGVPIHFGSVVGPVWNRVEKPTDNPNYEIQIFNSTECRGSAIAQGTAATLEGVGIPVAVDANAKTTLSAIQVDPSNLSEPSGCSNVLSYWEGNVPPEPGGVGTGGGGGESGGGEVGGGGGSGTSGPGSTTGTSTTAPGGTTSSHGTIGASTPAGPKPSAPNLHLLPSARANDSTPLVAGSAPGAENVAIYGNANCSGAPVAKGTPSQLSAGFEVSVEKNSSTIFTAVAIAAQHSGCSEPVSYTEDSTAPRTRITMGPGVKTRKHKAVFRFQDITEDPPGTTFVCKVDKAKWKPCSSPFNVKHLKPRHYVVAIRATDLAGNVERKPVKRRFIVVSPLGR